MSLFDRPKDTGLTPERIREVCDAIGEPTIPAPLHPERTPFTPEELDRLWRGIFPDEQPIERRLPPAELDRLWRGIFPDEQPIERRMSPAERARLDQLRAEFRDTL